jgi:hypothetical protein
MKKPHASTESGKPTKRESADEHQVTREDMGARREQRKRHHRSRKPGRQFFFRFFFFYSQRTTGTQSARATAAIDLEATEAGASQFPANGGDSWQRRRALAAEVGPGGGGPAPAEKPELRRDFGAEARAAGPAADEVGRALAAEVGPGGGGPVQVGDGRRGRFRASADPS